MGQNMVSVAKQVKHYIARKPYLLEAIEQNIVNYSALARDISKELDIQNIETIKAALIRASNSYRKTKRKNQEKAISILRDANISIKNKIAALHHSSYIDIKSIAYSKTPSGFMYFIDETLAKQTSFKKIEYTLAIIQIKSSLEIETTPGVIAYLLSALASEGINISHVMSCREDTFIVIKEHDAAIAFQILTKRLRP